MRILSFADTRFPIERANGIQTFETCHALARRGHTVRLVVRPDTASPARDSFHFYGAPHLDRFDVVPLRAGLGSSASVRRALFLASACEAASRRDADVVFTRDLGESEIFLSARGSDCGRPDLRRRSASASAVQPNPSAAHRRAISAPGSATSAS